MAEIKINSNAALYIGLISGTSMDGVDAALIDLSTHQFIEGMTRPYSREAKLFLNRVMSKKCQALKDLSQLNTVLGQEFAQAALELMAKIQIPASSIKAIGSHGQTICHDPSADIPYTLQLGCAHSIAELTNITVVADFRTRDLIIGGQGAPFAPIYHQALFTHHSKPLAVVNIGGIANLTVLESPLQARGYDVGPGNCLMDAWTKCHLNLDYDKQGEWAASGSVNMSLLDKLLTDSFFKKMDPKSVGKEYFSLEWLKSFIESYQTPADIQATLMMLTAKCIAESINNLPNRPKEILICGGGVHNLTLLQSIQKLLPHADIKSTAAYGIHPDFIEALMFAWLAEKTINNIPLDMNQITGAKREAVLGVIYPAGIDKRN
jgi:anhydro-N-acetylmuramic acid kinase